MSHLTDLPIWAAIPVCILLLLGSVITSSVRWGLIRLENLLWPPRTRRRLAPALERS